MCKGAGSGVSPRRPLEVRSPGEPGTEGDRVQGQGNTKVVDSPVLTLTWECPVTGNLIRTEGKLSTPLTPNLSMSRST